MKSFSSLALAQTVETVLIFAALLYTVFPGTEAVRTENPNGPPVITVELLRNQDKVFKYAPPSPGQPYERLSVESHLRFSNESIIFWESKDYNTGSGSGTEIKLRLKCEAPYLTKWTFTTHSKAKVEDTTSFFEINYSESSEKELSPQSNHDGGEFPYNVTELTVNGFGPEFKGGFINCVSRSDESVKSQLYIFQRFGANDKLKSVDQINRGVVDLTHIPCIVYDPDIQIKYEQFIPKFNDYKPLEASFTTYNWRLGYRIIRGGERDYRVGNKARCVLDNGSHVYYEFIEKNVPAPLVNNTSFQNRERLFQNVFHTGANYDTWNYPSNLVVQLGVSLVSLNANPLENTLQTNVLLRQLWLDIRYQWNPAEYGGERVISMSAGKMLKPDIKLLNSVKSPSIDSCAQTNIQVSSEGQVLWVTPCQFESTCNFSTGRPGYNFTGSQSCFLKFGTWAEDGYLNDIQLYKNKSEVDLELLEDVTQWEVTGSTGERVEKASKGGFGEIFPASLKFDIEFREK